jgi:hypothetical protein
MTPVASDALKNDKLASHEFVEVALGRLARIRNGVLIFDQDRGAVGEIDVSIRNLGSLRDEAVEQEAADLVRLVDGCEALLRRLLRPKPSPSDIGKTLDLVAEIEQRLLKLTVDADDFLSDISSFIESSFESLKTGPAQAFDAAQNEEFEIDEETLEIFRSEAGELLDNIGANIRQLSTAADDREALWEIRRNSQIGRAHV